MANSDVSPTDVQAAVDFMVRYLQDKIPDGDFSPGGPLYDFVVRGTAYVFAYLQKQNALARDRQSLLTLKNLPEEESVADAADAVLANFLRFRDQGTFARGPLQLHLSQRADALIPVATRFFKSRSLVYYVDSATDVFISAASLRPVLDASGRVTDWTTTIPVVAARVGSAYRAAKGRFVGFDRFSPYATYVEATTDYEDGADVQDTATFVAKSNTAVSLRAMVNARSNEAVTFEQFPAVQRILTVGYGDPEMVRDVVGDTGAGLQLHIGGHVDLYVRTALQEVVERSTVGATFLRPDDRVVVFREGGVDFVGALGVRPGDVLVVSSGLPEAPFQYKVRTVRTSELEVDERTPFSVATTESSDLTTFAYSIGDNYPLFNNKLVEASSSTAGTARAVTTPNGVLLAGRPVYAIKRVEVVDAPSSLDPYKDPVTGTILFEERVNGPITAVPLPGSRLQYRVRVVRPQESQSGVALTILEVGWPGQSFDGLTLEVAYDTAAGFEAFDAFVRDPENRVSAANVIARAPHPVYVSFTVPYRLPSTAATTLDEDAASAALASVVNDYAGADALDQSALVTEAARFGVTVYPFEVAYELLGPDGRVYSYATTDVLTVFPDGTNGARLLNPGDFGLPATGYQAALRRLLALQGVSDRTLRFRTSDDGVAFQRRA